MKIRYIKGINTLIQNGVLNQMLDTASFVYFLHIPFTQFTAQFMLHKVCNNKSAVIHQTIRLMQWSDQKVHLETELSMFLRLTFGFYEFCDEEPHEQVSYCSTLLSQSHPALQKEASLYSWLKQSSNSLGTPKLGLCKETIPTN